MAVRRALRLGTLALRAMKRVVPDSVRPALRRAIEEMETSITHIEGCRKAACLPIDAPLRLNIGCGAKRRSGWLNLDLRNGADIRLDIRRRLPFADGSCEEIYAEHVLEHLGYPGEVECVLREWFRLLTPARTLSIGVPDTDWPLRSYVDGTEMYFTWCRTQPWYPPWVETRLDMINYHFRQQSPDFGNEHRYAYDFETLAARLRAAGFVDVARRPFDDRHDSEDRRIGTLYVLAAKPATAASAVRR